MTVKPISLGKDLLSASTDLDSARLVSIINTNAAAIKVSIAGASTTYEIHRQEEKDFLLKKKSEQILHLNLQQVEQLVLVQYLVLK